MPYDTQLAGEEPDAPARPSSGRTDDIDDSLRAQVDDHVFIAIDRLAHVYVTGQLYDDAAIYNILILAREHITAAIDTFPND